MNGTILRTLTGSSAALVGAVLSAGAAGTGISLAAASASAASVPAAMATAPPWEPDPSSVGALVFFNAAGQVITGGSTSSQPVAAYVLGSATVRAGDTKATVYGFLPVKGQTPGQWSGEALGASTLYPNGAAPAPLNTSKLPVETGGIHDESVATLALDFPNNDTTSDGYAHMYQLRLYTSKPGESISTTYDSADIVINGNNTWSVVYAPQTSSATLHSSATSITKGQKVTLTTKVTPAAAAGSVQFYTGTTKIGTPATVTAGTATTSTTALPGGVDSLSAVFSPANPNLFKSSRTAVVKVTVKTPTATKITASPTSATKGQKVTLTATESPATGGSVQFYNGKSKLGSPIKVASKGIAVYATTALPVGALTLSATFTPASTTLFGTSTGTVKVTVKA